MQTISTIDSLREHLQRYRQANEKIALVPTMGNLHKGHLSIVKQAQSVAEKVVVSIFVNPTQFVEGEDFEHYPRTIDADLAALKSLDVDVVFMPETQEVYSNDPMVAEVTVPALDSIYCGEYRPGHFQGVATIVTKLFNMVQPDIALFGEKDFQQLLVIRSLVKTMNFPIEIIGVPTIREEDGLAMSSRNAYLGTAERQQAPLLYACLCQIAAEIKDGEKNYKALEENALNRLKTDGFRPEYLSICDADTLQLPKNDNIVIISAAWLGKARLIDNVRVQTYD